MIKVISTVKKLDQPHNALKAYLNFRRAFRQNQLFLLESLAGPSASIHKSTVGFNPIFTLKICKNLLSFSGHMLLCQAVEEALQKESGLKPLASRQFEIIDLKQVFDLLRRIEACFQVEYPEGFNLTYRFGFFGYLGYDAVHFIETLPKEIADHTETPEVILSIYEGMLYNDFDTNSSYLILNRCEGVACHNFDEIEPLLQEEIALPKLTSPPQPLSVQDSLSKQDYLPLVDKALEHIAIGDIYQIQLGHNIEIRSQIDPFTVYQRMREQNPSPFMYFTELEGITIIGASPELCINLAEDQITIRPIAGTIKRGKTEAEDQTLKAQLLNDPKERAEHIMLVDLARNDIGRVCVAGSLAVTELMVIERYSHVFHIVSNVIGKLASGFDHYDVIAASFPAGTLTGSPKIRAMELIEKFETTRRGIYGGCLGFIDFRGNTEMAICIRTACYQNDTYSIRASAGIVADSVPENEWQETINKMSAPYLAITGRELKNENFIN